MKGHDSIREYVLRAERGETLWLDELRKRFSEYPGAFRSVVRLLGDKGFTRDYELFFPPFEGGGEREFLLRYAAANVYNILSAFSGREGAHTQREDKNENETDEFLHSSVNPFLYFSWPCGH